MDIESFHEDERYQRNLRPTTVVTHAVEHSTGEAKRREATRTANLLIGVREGGEHENLM
jgi:hypothetical protein